MPQEIPGGDGYPLVEPFGGRPDLASSEDNERMDAYLAERRRESRLALVCGADPFCNGTVHVLRVGLCDSHLKLALKASLR